MPVRRLHLPFDGRGRRRLLEVVPHAATRISIRDIATRAGVSHTTVSLALRNDPRILPETRKRISLLAAKLGYRRDAVLGNLMAHLRTLKISPAHATLGFVTAWSTRNGWRDAPNHQRFFAGAISRANDLGYAIDEFWLAEPGMTSARMTAILRCRGIKGLILQSLSQPNGRLHLNWDHFACVTKGLTVRYPAAHRVVSSHYDDMQLAVRKLIHKGYRRLGLVLGRSHDLRVGRAWLASYCLHENEIAAADRVPAFIVRQAGSTSLFKQWLGQYRPDVILFAEQPVPDWIAELGLKAPRDIGLVHLDWSPESGPLAGIDLNPESLGVAAIDLLVGQLHAHECGIPRHEKVVEVFGRWVPGSSLR
jgi:LacI family transcriptional regulator